MSKTRPPAPKPAAPSRPMPPPMAPKGPYPAGKGGKKCRSLMVHLLVLLAMLLAVPAWAANTVILASGQTAADSSDVACTAGCTLTLFASSTIPDQVGLRIVIVANNIEVPFPNGTLNVRQPVFSTTYPGTLRVKRPLITAYGVSVGVTSDTNASGGASSAVTQSGTWTVQPGNTANTTPWLVTGTGGTFPVTGTFWQATQPVSLASVPTHAVTQSGTWTVSTTPTADSLATGNLTATNQAVTITGLNGVSNGLVQLSGTFVGSVQVEGSNDAFATTAKTFNMSQGTGVTPSTAALTTAGYYRIIDPANFSSIRVRASAYTSGTIAVSLRTTGGNGVQPVVSVDATAFQATATLAAGSAIAGKFGTDQTTHGTTDLVAADVTKLAGTAIDTNSGSKSGGTQRIVIASDQPVLTNPQPVFLNASTTGGWSPYSANVTNTAVAIDASPGAVGWYYVGNQNTSVCYLQLFNLAAASVTVGTTTPTYSLPIVAFGGANSAIPSGLVFATAISAAATTTRTGSTACTSGLDVNLGIK